MITWTMKGIKYTVGYIGTEDQRWKKKHLIPVDKENRNTILIDNIGSLSYLNRSREVSEAIQEWEVNHNTKLSPRN